MDQICQSSRHIESSRLGVAAHRDRVLRAWSYSLLASQLDGAKCYWRQQGEGISRGRKRLSEHEEDILRWMMDCTAQG